MKKPNKSKFLRGYRKLCKETLVYVSGCGCCGSPFLVDTNEFCLNEIEEHIEHLKEDEKR